MTFGEACKRYHGPNTPETKVFRSGMNATKKAFDALGDPLFNPPSGVTSETSSGSMMFVDEGFLTEGEFLKEIGLLPAAVKAKITTYQFQEGILKGVVVSLEGLDPSKLASIRKIRTWTDVRTVHTEVILDHTRNIRQEQGAEVYQFMKTQALSARSEGLAQKWRIPTVASFKEKAEEILKKREEQEAEEAAAQEEGNDEEPEDDEEQESISRGRAAPTLGVGLIAKKAESKKSARPKRKSKGGRSPSPVPSGTGSKSNAATVMTTEAADDLKERDGEMGIVAQKLQTLGRNFASLASLDVTRFLSGEKLGVQLEAVGHKKNYQVQSSKT